uniref:Uncharacterized protein n=1 Tax=Nomascus leucogenys TaxID=61853 RepID=A0A2I3GD43_NOMLE
MSKTPKAMELHPDDKLKLSNSSWWTNWVIPAISTVAVALMYHLYMAED